MKYIFPLAVLTACGLFAASVSAAEQVTALTSCDAKRLDITTKIEKAKAAGNSDQQAGLEKALSEIDANCTDASLIKEQENKVLDEKREVGKRQAELDKAMKKGDPEKINKRKDKLAEARKDLQAEQQKLEELQPDEDNK